MPNARRPAGPTKPVHVEREDANEREQIEDALGGAPLTDGHHAGKVGRRNPPSPTARNNDVAPQRDDTPDRGTAREGSEQDNRGD